MLQNTNARVCYADLVSVQKWAGTAPAKGKHKKGIHHVDLVDAIEKVLDRFKWKSFNWKYALSKDDYQFACSFELKKIPGLKFKGFNPSMGFQHSNDGKKKLRCCLGGVFLEKHSSPGFVFDPLHGEQKHTILFDLDKYLMKEMERAGGSGVFKGLFDFLEEGQERMKKEISLPMRDHILCTVGGRKMMGWRQIGQVLRDLQVKNARNKKTTVRDVLVSYGDVAGQLPPLKQLESLSCLRQVILDLG